VILVLIKIETPVSLSVDRPEDLSELDNKCAFISSQKLNVPLFTGITSV